MAMELQHDFTVPASVEETWEAFNDIESVAECFPGATVSSVEGDTFQGSCKVKLGPIALVYNGSGTFVEKDESARRMVIDAKGKDKRGNGTAGAHVRATMTDAGGGSTHVVVHTDLNITGKPAQFGRGVMQDVSDKLLGQFTACLEQKLGAGAAPEPAPEPVPEPSPEPQAERMHNMRDLGEQPAPTASAPAGESPRQSPPGRGSDDAIDLGTTVLPVLARTYWKQALGVVLVLLVLRRLLRS